MEDELAICLTALPLLAKLGSTNQRWYQVLKRILRLIISVRPSEKLSVNQLRLVLANRLLLTGHTNLDLIYLQYGFAPKTQLLPCSYLGCTSICRSKISFMDVATIPHPVVASEISYLTNDQLNLLLTHLYAVKSYRKELIGLFEYRMQSSIDLYYTLWWTMKVHSYELDLYPSLIKFEKNIGDNGWTKRVYQSYKLTQKLNKLETSFVSSEFRGNLFDPSPNLSRSHSFDETGEPQPNHLDSDPKYNVPFEPYGRIKNITSKLDKTTKLGTIEVLTLTHRYVYHSQQFRTIYENLRLLNLVDSFTRELSLYVFKAYLCGNDQGYLTLPNRLQLPTEILSEDYTDSFLSLLLMNLMFGIDLTQIVIDVDHKKIYPANYETLFKHSYSKLKWMKLTSEMEERLLEGCLEVRRQYYLLYAVFPQHRESLDTRFVLELSDEHYKQKLKKMLHPGWLSYLGWR